MPAGSTTTTPSSSRPFTTLTGTTVTGSSRPVRVARPWSMPAALSAAEMSSASASGTTTATLRDVSSAIIPATAAAVVAPSSSGLAARDHQRHGITDADRSRRAQVGAGRHQDAVGDRHDLRRDAVADGEPDDPRRLAIREVGEDVVPRVRGERAGRLGEVADDRQRAVQRPPCGHPQLHRGQILDLVDDDVPERPDLVGLLDPAAPASGWPEDVASVVEQGDVGRCPPHVGDVRRPLAGAARRSHGPRARRGRRGGARPGEPNRSWSSSAGVSTGHIRSSAARTSGS